MYGGNAAAVGKGVGTNLTQRTRYDEGVFHGRAAGESIIADAQQPLRNGHAGNVVLVVEGVCAYLDKGVVHPQVAHRWRYVEVPLQHLKVARPLLTIGTGIYQSHLPLRHMLQHTVVDRLSRRQD